MRYERREGEASEAASFACSSLGAELLDDPSTDPAIVDRMVRDIAVANRWLGGWAAVRFGLARLLSAADRGREFTLLDVGAGAADIPRHAVRWAARRDIVLRAVALDRIPAAARVARENGIPVVVASAAALPVGERGVDIVVISQLAHHFEGKAVARLFAACGALARRGVVVGELHRSALARAGFRVAGGALGLDRRTVADGVTSLRRGYTPAELRDLCRRAGVRGAEVRARPFWRIAAWWRTDADH